MFDLVMNFLIDLFWFNEELKWEIYFLYNEDLTHEYTAFLLDFMRGDTSIVVDL